MENTTEVKKIPAKKSFNGIQYSTKGDPTLIILDRAKNYFIAYAMDSGGRNQHLLYQFEFDDETKDPFLLPQQTVIDGKPCGEGSAIDILTKNFSSSRVGIHLFTSLIQGPNAQKALHLHFGGHYIRNALIIKAGMNHFEADKFQTGDALSLKFTANGIVLSRPGIEYSLERGAKWVKNETQ
ncbi:hypothetical protein HYFRA_00013314 [Hymenoscyphus fraxineus]|uniref:Uncharacterized protein n=1 Tax=Hymenoscyphus fraxineus TaxID=746836 RepID=A0A9N9LB39_9HELO|nr:hypothetical protein HYFRA_00013314 [Hymenoscyphus fraxineus]